jgi:hypothetical protein
MFTKGQPGRRHLLQYFGRKNSQLWLSAKNFEPDTTQTDEKSGLVPGFVGHHFFTAIC